MPRITSDNSPVTTAAQETSIFGEQPDPCIMMTLQTYQRYDKLNQGY